MSRYNPELWEKHEEEWRTVEETIGIAIVDALSMIADHNREQAFQQQKMHEDLQDIRKILEDTTDD